MVSLQKVYNFKPMNLLEKIARVLVGGLFVVSGLIKANDPLGFSYKLGEYFAEDVLNWNVFEPYTLQLAIFICVIEIVLGFATIFGAKSRLVSWSLLGMIVFFTFLTFYSAYYDKVTDCGCFGDALKLTPWESFYKDVVLLVLVLIIFIRQAKIKMQGLTQDFILGGLGLGFVVWFSLSMIHWTFPIWFYMISFLVLVGLKLILQNPSSKEWLMGLAAFVISLVFTLYCFWHLPIKDFRPYAIGKSIPEGMTLPEGAKEDVFETIMRYKNLKSGEIKEFTMQNYPWQDTLNWKFHDRTTELIEEGDHPPIHDFNLFMEDGSEITEDVLAEPYMLLVINYDIEKASKTNTSSLVALVNAFFNKGYYAYGLTASNREKIETYKHELQLPIDYLTADETVLKTIVRSNPGIVILKEGTVIQKWHINDIPSDLSKLDQIL